MWFWDSLWDEDWVWVSRGGGLVVWGGEVLGIDLVLIGVGEIVGGVWGVEIVGLWGVFEGEVDDWWDCL